jgi:PhnB protein
MKVLANLDFDGECREAFTAYAKILGGTIRAMFSHRDMPGMGPPVSEERMDRIIHAWIDIGDQSLMGQDMQDFSGRKGMSVTVQADTPDEARRIFAALVEGGEVQMPIDKQPWSEAFGVLIDRWGVPWVIDTAEAG